MSSKVRGLSLNNLGERVIQDVFLWETIADQVALTAICLKYTKMPVSDDALFEDEENPTRLKSRVISKLDTLAENLPVILGLIQKFMKSEKNASETRAFRLTITIFKENKLLSTISYQKYRKKSGK